MVTCMKKKQIRQIGIVRHRKCLKKAEKKSKKSHFEKYNITVLKLRLSNFNLAYLDFFHTIKNIN